MLNRRGLIGVAALLPLGTADQARALRSGQELIDGADSTSLASGEHVVIANITIKGDLILMPGAMINVAAGKTLTVLGDFRAPAARVFSGLGRVDLARGRLGWARPEWWGALSDSRIDCIPALESCIEAHHSIELGSGSYHLARTLRIATSNRRIRGVGRPRPELVGSTRLVLMGHDGDVVLVGTDRKPDRIIDFVQGVELTGLHLSCDQARFDADNQDTALAPAGLRVRYALNCSFQTLLAEDQPIGFSFAGTVRSFVCDCIAISRNDNAGANTAQFWGFHLDGGVDIGLAGGNASLYLDACSVNTTYGEPSPRSVGVRLTDAFADIYIMGFACAEVARGIMASGLSEAAAPSAKRAGNIDLMIIMPILDQCRQIALDIRETSGQSMIEVVSLYAATSPAASAGINLERCRGQISITGGQIVASAGLQSDDHAIGLCAIESDGISVSGLKLRHLTRPIVMGRCSDFDVAASVSNPDGGAKIAAALDDCRNGIVRVRVKGRERSFAAGVQIRNGESLLVETAGIDRRAIGRGSEGRVLYNGGPISPDVISGTIAIAGSSS